MGDTAMATPGLIDPSATPADVRLLAHSARRVGDGLADANSEAPNTVTTHTSEEYARLAANLAKLLADADANIRIGAARLIRAHATKLREVVAPGDLEQLKSAVTRACEDKSLNDYPYGGFQVDELDLVIVADEARLTLRDLSARDTDEGREMPVHGRNQVHARRSYAVLVKGLARSERSRASCRRLDVVAVACVGSRGPSADTAFG